MERKDKKIEQAFKNAQYTHVGVTEQEDRKKKRKEINREIT